MQVWMSIKNKKETKNIQRDLKNTNSMDQDPNSSSVIEKIRAHDWN
jgi:hypothetical protein